jgi:mono/diheme cytochrome c family protein
MQSTEQTALAALTWAKAICVSLACAMLVAPAAAAEEGAQLFEERCAACHGTMPDAPGATELGAMSGAKFRRAVRQHGNADGLVASLGDSQVQALRGYLAGRGK